jgi:hypothetical protein
MDFFQVAMCSTPLWFAAIAWAFEHFKKGN